jgi:phage baseplate assembly protein gpV
MVNAIDFAVTQAIRGQVNTSELVMIGQADQNGHDGPGGYASATPLVKQTDGFDNGLPATALHHLAYYRPQAGKAAIIMNPQPGDKALAVSMKRDSSGVGVDTKEAVQPGSHRSFDQADSILVNGVLGEVPETYLELDPATGTIFLSTKAAKIEISCRESGDIAIKTAAGNVRVDATLKVTVTCPEIILDGDVRITKGLVVEGEASGPGNGPAIFRQGIINRTGDIVNEGNDIKTNTVTLNGHTHAGVEPGGGDTDSPNSGT